MRLIIILLALINAVESMSQGENIDTLFFEKQLASLNSHVLVSLSQLNLAKNEQLLLKKDPSPSEADLNLYENCLFQRRAEVLKSFLVTQGIDSTLIYIVPTHRLANSKNAGIKKELLIYDSESTEVRIDYDQIAYASNPKTWHKKTGPEMGR